MSLSLRFFALFAAAVTMAEAAPLLINAQQRTYQNEPRYIRDRFEYIDSLPFDGLVISTDSGRRLMDGPALRYSEIALDFGPLTRLRFRRLTHNLAVVNVNRPADFFDDWSATVENFRKFAQVLRFHRIEGVFFDNEEYELPLFNYPNDCSYPSRPLAEYQAQARLRGRQIMEAMVKAHPSIVVMMLHGPYSSFAGTPAAVRLGQTSASAEELRGAFSVGMIEALGERATFVDGGEVYGYRTEADFAGSYDFRKTTIASAQANCPFIPPEVRVGWGDKVSIGFGVYNLPYAGQPMDSTILATTLERAMRKADRYVWLYAEGLNWNAPGEAGANWLQAVDTARGAVLGSSGSAPAVYLQSPVNRTLHTVDRDLKLAATAVGSGRSIAKVEFFSGTTRLGEDTQAPFEWIWRNPTAGTFRITARATDSAGVTNTSSPLVLTYRRAPALRVNFQPPEVTPAVGYFSDTGAAFGLRSSGFSYGWNVEHATNARLRPSSALDLHLATLVQIRNGARWEVALPPGDYAVTVGIGDESNPSTYSVNVEGVKYWSDFPLSGNKFARLTKRVKVTDGRLTLDPGGASFEATRVNFISIVGY